MQRKFILLLIIISGFYAPWVYGFEVDLTGYPTYIYDGDTFEINTGDVIRLADVDCPESYEYGYNQATDYLFDLINGKKVYLDIDDVYRTDRYGRLVCVVYVEQGNRLLNVNQALLDSGNAAIDNYENEFSPYTWNKYERTGGFFSLFDIIILVVIIAVLLRVRPWKKKQKQTTIKNPKYCTQCGYANKPESKYCINCGSKLIKR